MSSGLTLIPFLKKTNDKSTCEQLNQDNTNLKITLYGIIFWCLPLRLQPPVFLSNSIVKTIKQVVRTIKRITDSERLTFLQESRSIPHDETRELAEAMNELLGSLEKQSWIQKSMAEIATMYQGITDITELTHAFITKLAPMLEATYGVVYLRRNQGSEVHYVKEAGYALAVMNGLQPVSD